MWWVSHGATLWQSVMALHRGRVSHGATLWWVGHGATLWWVSHGATPWRVSHGATPWAGQSWRYSVTVSHDITL